MSPEDFPACPLPQLTKEKYSCTPVLQGPTSTSCSWNTNPTTSKPRRVALHFLWGCGAKCSTKPQDWRSFSFGAIGGVHGLHTISIAIPCAIFQCRRYWQSLRHHKETYTSYHSTESGRGPKVKLTNVISCSIFRNEQCFPALKLLRNTLQP